MNADLTPEAVEALDKTDIVTLRRTADGLHQGTAGVLDHPFSAADYERETRLRTAMKLKLDECLSWLADQIADAEALKREVRTLKGYASSDESRLESAMFNRLREERRGNA